MAEGVTTMSKGRKIVLGLVITVLVLVLLLIVIVPLLVNIDRYRPEVVNRLQAELGRPVQIGHLGLTFRPELAIRVDDFALGNTPGFPKGDVVRIHRVYAVVDAGALWDRRVIIKSLELSDPSISLLADSRGHWNFESPAKQSSTEKTSPAGQPMLTLGVISKLSVSGGRLTVADAVSPGESGSPYLEVQGFSSQLQKVNLNALTAATHGFPGDTPMARNGSMPWNAALLYAATTEGEPAAQGTIKADMARFQKLVASSVKANVRLYAKQVLVDNLSFDVCSGHANGNLTLNFAGPSLKYATDARLTGVDMARLLDAFPNLRGKMTGKMDANAKIYGFVPRSAEPLAGVQGSGQATVRNGQIPSLQLNRNLALLARLTNFGPATGDPSSFSSIAADFNIAEQRITSNKITVVGNGVGVDGSGALSLAGAGSLDYQGIASINATQNPLTGIMASLSGAKYENGKLTFPFAVGGTLDNPKFTLKSLGSQNQIEAVAGMLGQKGSQGTTAQPSQTQPQTPADLVQGIAGLFKKKKTTQDTQTQPPKQ
jgi:uncharacterized protein involved in outer membrane biogenesis